MPPLGLGPGGRWGGGCCPPFLAPEAGLVLVAVTAFLAEIMHLGDQTRDGLLLAGGAVARFEFD